MKREYISSKISIPDIEVEGRATTIDLRSDPGFGCDHHSVRIFVWVQDTLGSICIT